jgi:hypothetical protein
VISTRVGPEGSGAGLDVVPSVVVGAEGAETLDVGLEVAELAFSESSSGRRTRKSTTRKTNVPPRIRKSRSRCTGDR